jgi:uncharacterized membrane protein
MIEIRRLQYAEAGSIAPLGIGFALISLSVILVFTSVSSIFILQRRLTTMAEFAALSGARYGLSATDFVIQGGAAGMKGLRVSVDQVLDGVTREVAICKNWAPPLPVVVKLEGFEICGYGAAREG